mmetsp:Transcript_73506/g.115932  ORF Transcript_73506/g.115932 Transcript_73506/m.115932 type:complete len:596 (+) Transcript_73506:90-1877(+)
MPSLVPARSESLVKSSSSFSAAFRYLLAVLFGFFLKDLIARCPHWFTRFLLRLSRSIALPRAVDGPLAGKPSQIHPGSSRNNENCQNWAPALASKMQSPHSRFLPSFERLRTALDSYAEAGSAVGPNLCAVICDSSVSFLHRSPGNDWNEDSLFRIFSMTKPIVAVAFLSLVDQGLVSLDDLVGDYVPCFHRIRVLGLRSRQRSELVEQLQRMVFDPYKGGKAHTIARSQGALKEDGWLQLSFILRSPSMQKLSLREDVALDIIRNLRAVEVQIDMNRNTWIRRRGHEKLQDASSTDVFSDVEEPLAPLTLRMLLTHTAGFGYDFSLYRTPPNVVQKAYGELAREVEKGRIPDLASWCERIAQIPLLFHPGEDFRYGYSFDILGRVAEVVSGKPLNEFLQEAILNPLQMHDTMFTVPPSKIERLVPLRRHPNDKFMLDGSTGPLDVGCSASRWAEGNHSLVLSSGGAVEVMAGGLVSSLRDYVRFLEMLLSGGLGPDGKHLIRIQTLEMAMDGQQVAIATDGVIQDTAFGRAFGFLGEVVGCRSSMAGLVSWGGTAGTYFGVHPRQNYAFVFFAQSFGAPKVKSLFENELCAKLA